MKRLKNDFSDCRTIFVADRGLNTSDNIYWINGDNKADKNPRDGYVYGQSVRGADAEFKAWILEDGYQTDKIMDDDGNETSLTHKSRIQRKELHVSVTKPGSKKPAKTSVSVDQKLMVYYSEKYARKQNCTRFSMTGTRRIIRKNTQGSKKLTARS